MHALVVEKEISRMRRAESFFLFPTPRSPLCGTLSRECFCSKETLEEHQVKILLECFFATKTLTREKITAPEGVQFPVGTKKFGDDHLDYVAGGITSHRTKQ